MDWLIPALYSVDHVYDNLGIKPEDFDNPDSEWAPLQIERGDPEAEKAMKFLQQVIEEVRADNAYADRFPHERDYVLDGLQGTLQKFESQSISAGYIQASIERLRIWPAGSLARSKKRRSQRRRLPFWNWKKALRASVRPYLALAFLVAPARVEFRDARNCNYSLYRTGDALLIGRPFVFAG